MLATWVSICFFIQEGIAQEQSLLYRVLQVAQSPQITEQLNRMSIEEQIGQLIMPVVEPNYTPQALSAYKKLIAECKIGGLLYRKGNAYDQFRLTRELQTASPFALLISVDAEWGLAMRLSQTVRYPRMMGIAKEEEQELYNYGRDVAAQCKVMGIHVNFSPVLDINNNPNNPVIGTRSFGDNTYIVVDKGLAYAMGLEDGNVLSVAKHFPGHGNTSTDSHKTLPTVPGKVSSLRRTELYPFCKYVDAGLGGIMVGHLNVPALDNAFVPSSLSEKITTHLLQEEMGFKGLIFTDGLEMKGVQSAGELPISVRAILAGNDILLGPINPQSTYRELLNAYEKGELSADLVREKCRKILAFKVVLCGSLRGKEATRPSIATKEEFLHTLNSEYVSLANQLWLRSIEFISYKNKIFPIKNVNSKPIGILELNNKSLDENHFEQALQHKGISTLCFRLDRSSTRNVLNKVKETLLEKSDIIIININSPYAAYGKEIVRHICESKGKTVVVNYFFSPYKADSWKASTQKAKAVLMAYESPKEAKRAVATCIFGIDIPPIELDGVSSSASIRHQPPVQGSRIVSGGYDFSAVERIARQGIENRAYPGCQIAIIHKGKLIYNQAFGRFTFAKESLAVNTATLYDIASVTKIMSATPAIIQLVGQKKISLQDPVKKYLPEFASSPVGNITVEQLLLHEGGLRPTINFYSELLNVETEGENLISYKPQDNWVQIGQSAWGNPYTTYNPNYLHKGKNREFFQPFDHELYLHQTFYQRIVAQINATPVASRPSYSYSDVGFLILGRIVEEVSGLPLDRYMNQNLFLPLGLNRIGYNPLLNSHTTNEIAPTLNDLFIRKKQIHGTVEDETAACMGGVCGNAGIFANAASVAAVAYSFLNQGRGLNQVQVFDAQTLALFLRKRGIGGKRNLGFMVQYANNSNLPKQASPSTFGHTGFTGTAVWIDPQNELVFVFLSNRTHPTRLNKKLMNEEIRPRILREVYLSINQSR